LAKRVVLLSIAALIALTIFSSFLLIEVVRLNEELTALKIEVADLSRELTALKMEDGQFWYDANWVTKSVGLYPITSAEEAEEIYVALVNKAPRRSYWIIYFPEDNGLPLKLEALEIGSYYKVNGTFRNYAVNCPNARLTIVYSVFKNGTAYLENVKTVCPAGEHQDYHEYPVYP